MTTSRENSDITSAYELGANSYIVKPVDFSAFADVVKANQVLLAADQRAAVSRASSRGTP